MDSHFWNRPAGATITRGVTCLRWLRAISGNSAVIQRQFWPIGFTRPAPTGHSVRKKAYAYQARLWAVPKPERPTENKSDKSTKMPVTVMRLRAETEMPNVALGWI